MGWTPPGMRGDQKYKFSHIIWTIDLHVMRFRERVIRVNGLYTRPSFGFLHIFGQFFDKVTVCRPITVPCTDTSYYVIGEKYIANKNILEKCEQLFEDDEKDFVQNIEFNKDLTNLRFQVQDM